MRYVFDGLIHRRKIIFEILYKDKILFRYDAIM